MLKQNAGLRGIQGTIGKLLSAIPLSPNQWTLLSLLVAAVAAAMIASGALINGLLLFALAGAFDMVDGAVARARGEVSKLGGFIDGVADRFVEALFLFSFMFYPLPEVIIDPRIWLASVIFLGTCMPSFVRAYADHKEVLSREKALAMGGLLERSERIILILVGLAGGIFYSMEVFVYALILVCALSLVTILQRIMQACAK
jgi:archaetidylinositol phosphate synthase